MCVDLLMSKHVEGMNISSPSQMITLGMIVFTLCIKNSMIWINSRNFEAESKNYLDKHLKALRSDHVKK